MLRCLKSDFSSSVILSLEYSSSNKLGHSPRSLSAPVKDPSPPQTARQSIPNLIKFSAACNLPSRVRTRCQQWSGFWDLHEGHLDEPINVPPSPSQPRTSSHPTRTMYLPFRLFPPSSTTASSMSPSPAPSFNNSPKPKLKGASDKGAIDCGSWFSRSSRWLGGKAAMDLSAIEDGFRVGTGVYSVVFPRTNPSHPSRMIYAWHRSPV